MKPIDKAGPNAVAPRATVAAPVSRTEPVRPARSPTTDAAASVAVSVKLAAGAPPSDTERVHEIRKALEEGTYPILPARIADAMIAARFLLRTK
jgi:negative regulator of flagellin synthesis FlgM